MMVITDGKKIGKTCDYDVFRTYPPEVYVDFAQLSNYFIFQIHFYIEPYQKHQLKYLRNIKSGLNI